MKRNVDMITIVLHELLYSEGNEVREIVERIRVMLQFKPIANRPSLTLVSVRKGRTCI